MAVRYWFRFERHTGDANDNFISAVIVEAFDVDHAWDRIPTSYADGLEVDSEEDSLYQLWWVDGIPQHDDFYLAGSYVTRGDALRDVGKGTSGGLELISDCP